MRWWENFLRKKMFQAMIGEFKIQNDSLVVQYSSVEDANFQGRRDAHLPAEERLAYLIDELTLAEKVLLLGGYKKMAVHGIPRLGLPSTWCSDATSGMRCFPGGTAFPAGLVLAASWNPDLIREVGAAIGEEFRAAGVSILLGPGVNIYRVPTCGRNFEYMGEDPYLAGKTAAAYIQGAQSRGVITTVKHFAANNSDYDRHKTDSVVEERVLREIYFPAFKMAVQEGGSWGVMSAYNPVNGVYASENRWLLKDILREEWGFEGFVISDWNSLYSTTPAIQNGLNLEMPRGKWINLESVRQAMEEGELTEEDIDRMLAPLLGTFLKVGMYDTPQVDPHAQLRPPAHISLAHRSAVEGMVLLKNEGGLLPLDPQDRPHLVVLGRTAVQTPTGGGGSSYVHRPDSPAILDGVRAAFPESRIDSIPFRKARLSRKEKTLIRTADAVILAAGFLPYEESEGYDRAWKLPKRQGELIRRTAVLNPRTVVVLSVGGGLETESWIHHVPAVLHTFYLGEVSGDAVARVLSGAEEPAGRLPFTMAKCWGDFASTAYYVKRSEKVSLRTLMIGQGDPEKRDVWKMEYGEGLRVGYRHFDTAGIEPQFPFGHGLSYTTFATDEWELVEEDGQPVVLVTITNTGERPGSQVVQGYVHDLQSSVFRPDQELKVFEKVKLIPGESRQVGLVFPRTAFQFFSPERGEWVLEPGVFELRIGTSSREIDYRVEIQVGEGISFKIIY